MCGADCEVPEDRAVFMWSVMKPLLHWGTLTRFTNCYRPAQSWSQPVLTSLNVLNINNTTELITQPPTYLHFTLEGENWSLFALFN